MLRHGWFPRFQPAFLFISNQPLIPFVKARFKLSTMWRKGRGWAGEEGGENGARERKSNSLPFLPNPEDESLGALQAVTCLGSARLWQGMGPAPRKGLLVGCADA